MRWVHLSETTNSHLAALSFSLQQSKGRKQISFVKVGAGNKHRISFHTTSSDPSHSQVFGFFCLFLITSSSSHMLMNLVHAQTLLVSLLLFWTTLSVSPFYLLCFIAFRNKPFSFLGFFFCFSEIWLFSSALDVWLEIGIATLLTLHLHSCINIYFVDVIAFPLLILYPQLYLVKQHKTSFPDSGIVLLIENYTFLRSTS